MFLDTRSKMHHLCGNCFSVAIFLLSLIAAQQGWCKRPTLSVDPTDLGAYISVFTLEKNGCAKSNCSGWHKTTFCLPRLAFFLFLNNSLVLRDSGTKDSLWLPEWREIKYKAPCSVWEWDNNKYAYDEYMLSVSVPRVASRVFTEQLMFLQT